MEDLKKFLELQRQDGKETTFMNQMLTYDICALQMRGWLDEYIHLLPSEEPETFVKVFSPASDGQPFVIYNTSAKGFESVYEKVYDGELQEENIFEKIPDLARGRVICTYLSQVLFLRKHLIREFLEEVKGCKAKPDLEKDYISAAKASGYRSINTYLDVPVTTLAGEVEVRFELQLRTELQHTWANRAHPLVYKNRKFKSASAETKESVNTNLSGLSDMLHKVDCEFDTVREAVLKIVPP